MSDGHGQRMMNFASGAQRALSITFPLLSPHAKPLSSALTQKRSKTERLWLSNLEGRKKMKRNLGIWGDLSQRFTGSSNGKEHGWRWGPISGFVHLEGRGSPRSL